MCFHYYLAKNNPLKTLPIADCRLPIADCRLPIADCRLPLADYGCLKKNNPKTGKTDF